MLQTQSELAVLNRKMQQCMQNLEKSEERRLSAHVKLAQAMETAEDAKRYKYSLLLYKIYCKNLAVKWLLT